MKSQWSEKVNIIIPQVPFDLVVEHFRLIFTSETELGVFRTGTSSLLVSLLLPYNSPLFLHSSVPLRSVVTEAGSITSIVARLKLTKWFLFCQESHAWFSFSKALTYLLTIGIPSDWGLLEARVIPQSEYGAAHA